MSEFAIDTKWLEGDLDAPEEAASFGEVSVTLGGRSLSQIYDYDREALAEGPRLPVSGLVTGLLRLWWPLLYEPQKLEDDHSFEARHRLDAFSRGYVFPPIALWSSGEAVNVSIANPDTRFQRQVFLLPENRGPWPVSREEAENALGAFVQGAIDRLDTHHIRDSEIHELWRRIVESTHDHEELSWCINAGRLGLDPYDPDIPDLGRIGEGLSDTVFADVCESTEPAELSRTCNWVRGASARLQGAPALPIKHFGAPHRRDLTQPGWREGYDSARLMRSRTGLPRDPRRAVEQLFGDAVQSPQTRLDDGTPASIEGLTRRHGGEMRAVVSARSLRQRRFRMCRAAYLGWRSGSSAEAAITTAITWRQQASRAFAAEILSPAELLRERAGKTGLTQDVVDRLATEWICPPLAIIHQAQNHGVPLRGVEAAAHY